MNTLVIADVHGCFEQLDEILRAHKNRGYNLVFLGDYIDRAPLKGGDLRTINLVRSHTEEPLAWGYRSCVALRGNHEQLFLDAVDQDDFELWQWNGGDMDSVEQLKQHYHWINSLPYYHTCGEYLFVHAGVRPDVPIEEQTKTDLLWIRDPFLKSEDHGLNYVVVHGHTIQPSFEVEHHPGPRIAMDCGSFHSGVVGHALLKC